MGVFQGFSGESHVLEDLCIGTCVLQSFPLELNGAERAVNFT